MENNYCIKSDVEGGRGERDLGEEGKKTREG